MLEETVRNSSVPPAEAAVALLNFVRYELPAGGAAEARFIRIFPLLCDRLFGPLQTTGGFRHEPGGWLSQQLRWQRTNSSSTTSPGSRIGSPVHSSKEKSLDNDPVVQLLAGSGSFDSKREQAPSLIEAISAETEHRPGVRFPFPFQGLPKRTQDLMLALQRSVFGANISEVQMRANTKRLCESLLRVPLKNQKELILYQQKKSSSEKEEQQRPLQLSPGVTKTASPSSAKQPKSTPHVMFSMLEYYLILFIRFPLATPVIPLKYPQPQGRTKSPNRISGGSTGQVGPYYSAQRKSSPHYGKSVYFHLFRDYLKTFLPHARTVMSVPVTSSFSRESELFLSIIIEFWIDGEYIVPTTVDAARWILERRSRQFAPNRETSLNLSDCFDMIPVKEFSTPPSLVQRSIRSLVNHLVSDPAVSMKAKECYKTCQRNGLSTLPSIPPSAVSCLSPPMTVLQQSFYNYVRLTFRHAPLHVADSPFYTALQAWLVWLEPWNVKLRPLSSSSTAKNLFSSVSSGIASSRRSDVTSTISVPAATSPSRYTPEWEPYVASNLHMYTVPLAIFIRRARELDFSSREFNRSIQNVQRVFRVFSPAVVDTIDRLLSASPQNAMVAQHERTLAEFSPSLVGQLSLASCSQDMHTLLEEIYMQHMKTMQDQYFLDRLGSWIEGIFSQGTGGDLSKIKALIAQSRAIVNFPVDFVETGHRRRNHRDRSTKDGPASIERTDKASLTEGGREQIITGSMKMNPLDVVFRGDNMTSAPNTYEISMLVRWLISLSNWLNWRLGLVQNIEERGVDATRNPQEEEHKKLGFRINLRFLADYRNVLFIFFVSWVMKMFRA